MQGIEDKGTEKEPTFSFLMLTSDLSLTLCLCTCSGYMVGGVHYGRNGASQNSVPWPGLYPYLLR